MIGTSRSVDNGSRSLRTFYNRVAGRNVHRLEALSDGVFALAMTLLVLDLHTPAVAAIHAEADLWRAVVALSPRVVIYLMSFLTLSIFWVGQQSQINYALAPRMGFLSRL